MLVGGCRTADKLSDTKSLALPATNLPETQSVTQPFHQENADVSVGLGSGIPLSPGELRAAAPFEQRRAPAFEQADTYQIRFIPPPAAESSPDQTFHPTVRLAAYGTDVSAPQVPVPDPLPSPPPSRLELSNLNLVDLEGLALQRNPALALASARVDAAQGNWVQTGLAPNPVVGYSGQQLGSGGLAEQQGVFIGQEFVTGHKLGLNRAIATWEIERAEQELEATRIRVLTDVRIGFYQVLIAQRRRDLAADLVRISAQGIDAAQSLFDSNEVSQVDPIRARVEADTARIFHHNSINQHTESWRQLTAVLGMPTLEIQRLAGELNPDSLTQSWEETLRQLLQDSPEIAAAIADVEAARRTLDRAHAEVIPNVDVQAVIQDDRGTGATNGNLQVSVPLPIWNRNQGGIQKARAEVAAAEQAVDRLTMNLQARLATAFQRYESARRQVEIYSRKDGIIDNVQRSLDLVQTGYAAGEFRVLDLLSAQRMYSQTNLALLDSLREQSVSVAEIRGMLLRDSLTK